MKMVEKAIEDAINNRIEKINFDAILWLVTTLPTNTEEKIILKHVENFINNRISYNDITNIIDNALKKKTISGMFKNRIRELKNNLLEFENKKIAQNTQDLSM